MKLKFLLALAVIASTSLARADEPSPELVVHLLDYLAKDYAGAVQNGKVISKGEYDEQVEFGGIVEKNSIGVAKLKADPVFLKGVLELQGLIKSKGAAEDVAKLARKLQQDAIRLAGIQVAPTSKPDLALGNKLFQANCVSCHGDTGHGNGLAGANLDPKPANFHDPDLIWNSAPYKFYNTIRLGVPGTGMMSFAQLSDQEVWALAFYLKSLPHAGKSAGKPATSFTVQEIATLTDAEMAERLGGDKEEATAVIGSIRSDFGGPGGGDDPLKIAEQYLDESLAEVRGGDYSKASTLAVKAYLEGIEPLEPKMKANLPGSVEQIEALMSAYRSALSAKEPLEKLEPLKLQISAQLTEVAALFANNKMSPSVAFGAAFSIFLREGFEAVLIIIVLISILRAMGQPNAIRWVHVGWASAVLVGIVAWFASGALIAMSGMSRELMEGLIALFAVVVLLYVGFWLHRYSEVKKWRAFLETKLRHGMGKGSNFALALVAFMAVFREAFEVVLFLRAIWIDLDSSGQNAVSGGVLASILLLAGVSVLAVKESKKLPLGLLFRLCSWTMVALAFVLAGKGAHSLQEAGFIGVSTISFWPRMDLAGMYPSVQTLLAQFIVVALIAGLFISERMKRTSSGEFAAS